MSSAVDASAQGTRRDSTARRTPHADAGADAPGDAAAD